MEKSIIARISERGGGFLTSPDSIFKGFHQFAIAANL